MKWNECSEFITYRYIGWLKLILLLLIESFVEPKMHLSDISGLIGINDRYLSFGVN